MRGKPAQNLADGGMVHSLTGMLGLRKRTPEELRAADAKAQARNQEASAAIAERAKSAPAPSPAPSGGSTAALSGYSGMTAVERREKAAGFKAGGVIRGPGTGTSDSIETEKEPGTFIMPADSTQAIGPDALEEMGEKVPVRLSNGEFEFPPDQVQALGEAVLTVMRDATHQPVDGGTKRTAHGFVPHQSFANGGLIDSEVTRVGNSYSGGNVSGGIAVNGQSPGGTVSTSSWASPAPAPAPAPSPTIVATNTVAPAASPAPAPAAPMGWAERNAQRSNEVTASSIMDSPERRAAQASLGPTPEPAPAPVATSSNAAPVAAGFQPASQRVGAQPQPRQLGAGFQPRRYADGGVVKDEDKQRLANQTSMYVQGAQAQAASRPPAVPAPAAPAAPAPAVPRAAGFIPGLRAVASEAGKTVGDLANQGRYGAAAGETARALLAAGPAMVDDVVGGALRAVAPPVIDAGKQFLGMGDSTAPAPQGQAAPQAASAAPAAQTPTAPEPVPTAPPEPAMADQQPIAAPAPGAVTREGNSYSGTNVSGDVSINGVAPRNGGQVSTPGQVPTAPVQPTPAGFVPASMRAPVLRNSTNDWAARKALENAATSASSITNNGGKFDRSGPGDSVAMAAYKAALATDQASQQAQAGMDQAALRENAGLQREGMQQEGATTRTGIQEQGAGTREAGRNSVAQGELALRRTAAGFQTRAAAQLENLQAQYTAEKDAGKRAELARQIREFQGKEQAPRFKVAAGGQQMDASGVPYKVPDRIFNEQTGEVMQQQGQGGAPQTATPPSKDSLVRGQLYQTARGAARWNGQSFDPV
ncbi:MAG: hypothetical protein QE485_10605 [Acidovorax sp.]|uniref:hypothetical protein n=1 Tax=Acidovorax sp. TaxID=1872122 RepID=UPI0026158212|nr:hypothetical protein [Acidovorax sp.]MDH4417665.1 hypothetical protein [Acidovorax sp.]